MASPTSTSIPTSSPAAKRSTDDWSDFISTIGTAVGPLVTLFGELATKQFLSMSMGWADNILLATGPIGVITIVVSAIRIGGSRSLKALIGRGREARATAEQEFLSSTSEEVCELWSGRGVVRVADTPEHKIEDLLVVEEGKPGSGKFRITKLVDACAEGLLSCDSKLVSGEEDTLLDEIGTEPACIALNVPGAILSSTAIWTWALSGIILQSFMIVFNTMGKYHWKWPRKGKPVPDFAYYCFLGGTIAMSIGLLGCSHIIEASTTEHTFRPTSDSKARIVSVIRLQPKCTVGGQQFPAFAILDGTANRVIRTSRLNDRNYHFSTILFGALTLIGFIVQFIGLGSLHWSATIVVLGISLLMTVFRALVRRGLATNPLCAAIPNDIELVWIAVQIVDARWKRSDNSKPQDITPDPLPKCNWGILTGCIESQTEAQGLVHKPATAKVEDVPERNIFSHAVEHIERLRLSRLQILHSKSKGDQDSYFEAQSKQCVVLGFCKINETRQCSKLTVIASLRSLNLGLPAGRCADLASKVATAMIGVKGYLKRQTLEQTEIDWFFRYRSTARELPWDDCAFRIDVLDHLGINSSWVIPIDDGEDGHLAEEINAGLSLWMYSLLTANGSLEQAVKDDVAFEFLFHWTRIVGNSKFVTIEELREWMPDSELRAVSNYDEASSLNTNDKMIGRPLPVLGLCYSSSFTMISCHNETSEYLTVSSPEDKQDSQDHFWTPSKRLPTIDEQCALEIFSLFMLSVCMSIHHVRGEVRHEDGRSSFSVVTELAEIVFQAGLVDDPRDAFIYIVPAFAKYGLLPKKD